MMNNLIVVWKIKQLVYGGTVNMVECTNERIKILLFDRRTVLIP